MDLKRYFHKKRLIIVSILIITVIIDLCALHDIINVEANLFLEFAFIFVSFFIVLGAVFLIKKEWLDHNVNA